MAALRTYCFGQLLRNYKHYQFAFVPIRNVKKRKDPFKIEYGKNKKPFKKGLHPWPSDETRTLDEKFAELNRMKDPILDARVNIGFSSVIHAAEKFGKAKKQEADSEKGNLDEVLQNNSTKLTLPKHIEGAAEHYAIFDDLFRHGYFTPWVVLDITYDYDHELVTPVQRGNIITASEVGKVPHVEFQSHPDDLWTLILSNPDGCLFEQDAECLHWFVGNIRGGDVSSGEVVVPYLQPFPPRGTGYHRMVFVLYKQDNYINYDGIIKPSSVDLEARTFKMFDFYHAHQEYLTPAGLAFYQTLWDNSVSDIFHDVLDMEEPVYEYCHKPQYFRPQVVFPEKQPFNLYLDRYRDEQDIRKEVLLKRLKLITPFEEEKPPFKYPNAFKSPAGMPSWLRTELSKERNRISKYTDLRPHSLYGQPEYEYKGRKETTLFKR